MVLSVLLSLVKVVPIPFNSVPWVQFLWIRTLQIQEREICVSEVQSSCYRESESHSVVSDSFRPPGLYSSWNSLGQNTEVGSLSLLQGIFPIQGSNPDLPHCRWIFYQVSHKGSARILEWVAYPFSSRSSWPRSRTRVSCIKGRFFTNWAIRDVLGVARYTLNHL